MLFFLIAPTIAAAPSSVAVNEDKLPIKLPIGVLAADTITTESSVMPHPL
jgi:hypothetical protein